MEEIDIIELLKRVKEGKAPRKIDINGSIYNYEGVTNILFMYECDTYNMFSENIGFGTKIKILDKPIIEEPDTIIGDLENPSHNEILILNWIRNNRIKINEIIRRLNERNL